jgi:hypothetical protein
MSNFSENFQEENESFYFSWCSIFQIWNRIKTEFIGALFYFCFSAEFLIGQCQTVNISLKYWLPFSFLAFKYIRSKSSENLITKNQKNSVSCYFIRNVLTKYCSNDDFYINISIHSRPEFPYIESKTPEK